MFPSKRLPFLLAALPLAATAAAILALQPPAEPAKPTVVPLKASGIYGRGEEAGWTVTPAPGAAAGPYRYTIRENNEVVVRTGELTLGPEGGRVLARAAKPTMLTLELAPPGGKPSLYGAAVAPTELKPVVPRPRDFDAFWRRKLAELRAVPANPAVTLRESPRPEVEYGTIRMDHVHGTGVYGQIARPKMPGKRPALLILQWASPPYPLDPWWILGHAADGWLVLNIQPHDVLPTEPKAYYDALPDSLKNYAAVNQRDRERNYFVEMYLRGVRAADYHAGRPDWDGETLVVMGTSMGGQQSLAVAGLHPKVTHMIVNEPAGCDLNAGLHGRQQGYPNYPVDDPKAMEAARYIDGVNFAPRIRATSLVAMGFTDTVTPPAGIWTAFNLIRGPKEAAPMVDSPHNHLATPEQQRPFTARSAEWLQTLAEGRKIAPDRRAAYEGPALLRSATPGSAR